MDNLKQIPETLKKLHSACGKPRLEIEGAGEPSIEAQYLGWISRFKQGEGNRAAYILNDWYEDTSFVLWNQVECFFLPKEGIESLVEYALSSGPKASLYTIGQHFKHYERLDDYTGAHTGEPAQTSEELLEISLDIGSEKPVFSLRSLPFIPYPKDLPPIAVYNRLDLCINCGSVWLEPFGGRDPDSNHCVDMDTTYGTYKNLTPEQLNRFSNLAQGGVLCPCFVQTGRYSK